MKNIFKKWFSKKENDLNLIQCGQPQIVLKIENKLNEIFDELSDLRKENNRIQEWEIRSKISTQLDELIEKVEEVKTKILFMDNYEFTNNILRCSRNTGKSVLEMSCEIDGNGLLSKFEQYKKKFKK